MENGCVRAWRSGLTALGLAIAGMLAQPVGASSPGDVVLRQVGDVHCGMRDLHALPDGQSLAMGKCGRAQLLQRIAADGAVAETRLDQWTLGGDNILFGAVSPATLGDSILLGWYSGVDGEFCEYRRWRPGESPQPLPNRRLFGGGCFAAARVDAQSSIIVGRNSGRRQVIVQRIVEDGRFRWFNSFPDASVAGTLQAVPQSVSFGPDGTVAIVGYFRHTGLGLDGQRLLVYGNDGALRHELVCGVPESCAWTAAVPVDGDVVAVARLATGAHRIVRVAPGGAIVAQADLPTVAEGSVRLVREAGFIAVVAWPASGQGSVDLALLDLQLQLLRTATQATSWSAGVVAVSSTGSIATFGSDPAQRPVLQVLRADGSARTLALADLGPIVDACCIAARPGGGFLLGASAQQIGPGDLVAAADAWRIAVDEDAVVVWSGTEGAQVVPTEPVLLAGDDRGIVAATSHIDRTQSVIWRATPSGSQLVASESLSGTLPRALWARGDGALGWQIGASGRPSAIGGVDAPDGPAWTLGLADGGDAADALAWGSATGVVLRWPGGAPERGARAIGLGPGGSVLADTTFARTPGESFVGAWPGATDGVWLHSRGSAIGTTIPLRRIELDGSANVLRDETVDLSFAVGQPPTVEAMPLGRWLVVAPASEAGRFDARLIDGAAPPLWQRLIEAPPGTTPVVRAAGGTTWLAFGQPGSGVVRLQAIDADGTVQPISPAIRGESTGRIDCDAGYCIVVTVDPEPQGGCRIVATVVAQDGGVRSSGERRSSVPCRFVAAARDGEFAWVAWSMLQPGSVQAAVLSPITSLSFGDGFE